MKKGIRKFGMIICGVFTLFLYNSCKSEDEEFKATGVFESIEVVVSSESRGQLSELNVLEGEEIQDRTFLGLIDTTDLHLSKNILLANRDVLIAKMPDITVQIEATKQEIEKQYSEKKRIEKLVEGDVATQKQLDDINASIGVLEAKLASQKSNLGSSTRALYAQLSVLDAELDKLNNQINKCQLLAPIKGTVLVKYVENGELVMPGKPVLKLADLNQMVLKAYVTASQLSDLKIGQKVQVFAEMGKTDLKNFDGTISWVSSKAEFTPKTVQTQDERANLVYAVKVSVLNDETLKIGMYGHFKLL